MFDVALPCVGCRERQKDNIPARYECIGQAGFKVDLFLHTDIPVSQCVATQCGERVDRHYLVRHAGEFRDPSRASKLDPVALPVVERDRLDGIRAELVQRPVQTGRRVLSA